MMDETDREEDTVLAAEYALGLLTPAEAREFEARLVIDPELRETYARWATDLVTMTDDLPGVAPSRALKGVIEARLFPPKRTFWQKVKMVPLLLGGLAVAAVMLAIINLDLLTTPEPASGPSYRAEMTAEDSSLVVSARYDPSAGTLQVERIAGSAREGRVLELWLIAGAAAPVSLGVLPEDQMAELVLPRIHAGALGGSLLAISDEPPGGSPTGSPTGEVLAAGALSEEPA